MLPITTLPMDEHGWFLITGAGYTATAKVFDAPSKSGLLGGRISKLQIQDQLGQQIFNYDRGGFDADYLDDAGREFFHAIVRRFDVHPLPWWVWFCLGFTLTALAQAVVGLLGGRDAAAE